MALETSFASNLRPIAVIASPLAGSTHMHKGSISFSSAGSQDSDGYITARRWYIDGVYFSILPSPQYSVELNPGELSRTVTIGLEVRDDDNTWSYRTNRTITISLSGRTEYYLTDHLGSVRTTIDQHGNVLGYDDFDPFGNVLPGRSYNAGTPNDLNKFTGHERDQEGGLDLDYMLARNYDSELGRFYSVDPLQFLYPHSSSYAYVNNNPISFIDPTGMAAIATKFYDENNNLVYDDNIDNGLEVKTTSAIINNHSIDGVVNWDGVRNDPNSNTSAVDKVKYDNWVQEVSNQILAENPAIRLSTDNKGNISYITSDDATNQLYLTVAITLLAPELVPRLFGFFAAKGVSGLLKVGNALDKGGFTAVGKALQKHGSRTGSIFPKATGNASEINAQGEAVLNGILTNPNVTSVTRHHARFGNVLEYKIPGGQGARFSGDGKTFIGFLE